ncbi:MAG: GHMP kinase, partial [Gemmatimonadales bacterium]
GGIEIISRSDAPAGSGLGASGALDVALVAGLARLREETYTPEELAELGYHVEANELSLLGGRQDQYAAALGGFHFLSFGEEGVGVRRLALSQQAVHDLERHTVLAYTGRSHFSSDTHARVWERYRRGETDVCTALDTLRDLCGNCAEALEGGDWRRLAELVSRNWREQQKLDGTITTPRIREMESAAREAGAWGLKATGAGAGGCMVAIGPPDAANAIREVFERLGAQVLDFTFSVVGVQVIESEVDAPPG